MVQTKLIKYGCRTLFKTRMPIREWTIEKCRNSILSTKLTTCITLLRLHIFFGFPNKRYMNLIIKFTCIILNTGNHARWRSHKLTSLLSLLWLRWRSIALRTFFRSIHWGIWWTDISFWSSNWPLWYRSMRRRILWKNIGWRRRWCRSWSWWWSFSFFLNSMELV